MFLSFVALYKREVSRFLKVWGQTILSPFINTLLFVIVFSLIGSKYNVNSGNSMHYVDFLLPGLIMMSIINVAFSNTSSSLIIAKMQGILQEILTTPLTSISAISGYTLGGVTRSILVAIVTWFFCSLFTSFQMHNVFITFYFLCVSAAIMSVLGIMAGIMCSKFEQISNFTTLIITPLTMLSGTFYSTDLFPEYFQTIIHKNPFFYMIDGFRYGIIGYSNYNIWTEAIVLFVILVLLFIIVERMWYFGYKIKN